MSFNRARRGMSLLEILVAAAIGLVIIAAAFSVFTGLSAMQTQADRKLETIAELNIGTQRQLRTLENAGSNLRAARLSVRVSATLPQLDYYDSVAASMAPSL